MYQQQRVSIKSPHTTIEGRRVKKICIILDRSNVVHGILIMPEDIFDIKGILNFFFFNYAKITYYLLFDGRLFC